MSFKHFEYSRRDFLKFLGSSAIATSSFPLLSNCTSTNANTAGAKSYYSSLGSLSMLPPSREDKLGLIPELKYQLLLSSFTSINKKNELFGFNCDYTAFIPLKGDKNEGILWVNHESPPPAIYFNQSTSTKPSKDRINKEMESVGGSLIHLKKNILNNWDIVIDSPYNRRLSGNSPIPFAADSVVHGSSKSIGTMGNCAGGITPWGTFLSCEENTDDYFGTVELKKNGEIKRTPSKYYQWDLYFDRPAEHYGWVLEIDPLTGSAKKHLSMGRFAHECATTIEVADGRCVVYLADDAEEEHLYKFISHKKGFLETGDLYVADLTKGKWLSLDLKKSPELQKVFKTNIDILTHTRVAAKIMGATPLDRPEDIEIDPRSGAVYVTLTNNKKRNNYFGKILKIEEDKNDHTSMTFKASDFLIGGETSGIACPDNLCFDPSGHLWITNDISSSALNSDPYKKFANNGLYFVPLNGKNAGVPIQIASAPVGAELTGPSFSPDGSSLFLSVQHPGEGSILEKGYTSTWPTGVKPLPSIVVISSNH